MSDHTRGWVLGLTSAASGVVVCGVLGMPWQAAAFGIAISVPMVILVSKVFP